jgi:hypothetical protein
MCWRKRRKRRLVYRGFGLYKTERIGAHLHPQTERRIEFRVQNCIHVCANHDGKTSRTAVRLRNGLRAWWSV